MLRRSTFCDRAATTGGVLGDKWVSQPARWRGGTRNFIRLARAVGQGADRNARIDRVVSRRPVESCYNARPLAAARGTEMRPTVARVLAIIAAVGFAVSLIFPAAAGLSHDTETFPKWWGVADVSLAFVIAALAIAILAVTHNKIDRAAETASYQAYRFLLHEILVACVVFMYGGDRIVWVNCATGFAWRIWLLLYMLPIWLTALNGK
jgi:hypothetical protein